jgi:hypothetical protein
MFRQSAMRPPLRTSQRAADTICRSTKGWPPFSRLFLRMVEVAVISFDVEIDQSGIKVYTIPSQRNNTARCRQGIV